MISLEDIVNDPDFAEQFSIERSSGAFVMGVYEQTQNIVKAYGVVTPSNPEEMQQVAEGDRLLGSITVKSSTQFLLSQTTAGGGQENVADVIDWNNDRYRVVYLWPWQDFGYYKCIANRIASANG